MQDPELESIVSHLLEDEATPSRAVLDAMVQRCLELREVRGETRLRRTLLGSYLRETMGATYQKGWINFVLAAMEAQGKVRTAPNDAFVDFLAPASVPAPVPAPAAAAADVPRATLVVNGEHFEQLISKTLQGWSRMMGVDVSLFIQRLEVTLRVKFVRKTYLHSLPPASHTSFHRMLNTGPGFHLEHHACVAHGVALHALTTAAADPVSRALFVLTMGPPQLSPTLDVARLQAFHGRMAGFSTQNVYTLGTVSMVRELLPFAYHPPGAPLRFVDALMATCVVPRTDMPVRRKVWCHFGHKCKFLADPQTHREHLEAFLHPTAAVDASGERAQ